MCRQWYEPGHHNSFQYADKGDHMEMNIMATAGLSLMVMEVLFCWILAAGDMLTKPQTEHMAAV